MDELTLEFDLVLNNQWLVLWVNWLRELGRDGVVSSLVLDYKTFVANHAIEDRWLLDSPVADKCPLLGILFLVILLLCVRSLPPGFPIVCELFEEGSTFNGCGLGSC
jgi:hypothetical protein